jgi:hypothetical protein
MAADVKDRESTEQPDCPADVPSVPVAGVSGVVRWNARLVAAEAVLRLSGGLTAVVGPFGGKDRAECESAAWRWLYSLPMKNK